MKTFRNLVVCLGILFIPNMLLAGIVCDITESSQTCESEGSDDCEFSATIMGADGVAIAYCDNLVFSHYAGESVAAGTSTDCYWQAVPPDYCPCPTNTKGKTRGSGEVEVWCNCTTASWSDAHGEGNANCWAHTGHADKDLSVYCGGTWPETKYAGPQEDNFTSNWTYRDGCTQSCSDAGTVSAAASAVLVATSAGCATSSADCEIVYYTE